MVNGKDRKLVTSLVERYIDILKQKHIEVEKAYLFGSYAKGTANEWSDIDVAILTKEIIGDSFDFKFLLMKIARDIDIDIEPHPYLIDEFTEDNPFAAEILKTGQQII